MATITRIIETEQDNHDRIHLFREGLFFKAHQHSAFLFNTQIKSFKTVKKYYKAAECDVVMLGFPSNLLNGLFPDPSVIEEIGEGHICVKAKPLDKDAYEQWFATIQPAPAKKKKQKSDTQILEGCLNFDNPTDHQLDDFQRNVLRELDNFDVGNATPIECMVLIGKLKSDLKRGISGCL